MSSAKEGLVSQLAAHWDSLLSKKGRSPLLPREREEMQRIRDLKSKEVKKELRELLKRDVKVFDNIGNQLESLLDSWEDLLEERRRFEGAGGVKDKKRARAFLLALKVIPGRACIGLSDYSKIMPRAPKNRKLSKSSEEESKARGNRELDENDEDGSDTEFNAANPMRSKPEAREEKSDEDADVRELTERIRRMKIHR